MSGVAGKSITLTDLHRAHGGGPKVLHGITLDIRAGEFTVIVGPSGCGKSTLLRLIAGLDRPDQGRILIGASDATDLAPQDRDIAMIFQNYALYPHMTVAQNIAFGLELRRVPKRQRRERAADVASLLRLTPYLDRKPAALSGGQRQRVAMGRALARDTRTFLMDEPLSNLDAALRTEMRAEIKALHRQLGATIVYVTHDQTEALSLADRIAVMKDGRVLQYDTPEAIYDRPADRFVAGFLGSPAMNFIPAAAVGRGGDDLLLGLRPEMLTVHAAQPPGPALEARLALSEMAGSTVILHCDTAAGRLTVTAPREVLATVARRFWLGIDPARALRFDRDSGRRLDATPGSVPRPAPQVVPSRG